MAKTFNISGTCYPEEHYMVDLESRLVQIKALVDNGKYFVINRGRQYGKTTTLWALEEYLHQEYLVLSLDFQRMSTASFQDEYTFQMHLPLKFCEYYMAGRRRQQEWIWNISLHGSIAWMQGAGI